MTQDTTTKPVAAAHLRSIVERIERLQADKADIARDIREVYVEAMASGFDTKALREIIKLRKKTPYERSEELAILDLYLSALGMAD